MSPARPDFTLPSRRQHAPRRRAWPALLLAWLVMAVAVPRAVATPGEIPIGGVLRDATLKGLNGPPRVLSSYRGKPLVINVWASWCGPCREEAASLERLAWGELGGEFNVIGISTDDDEANAQAWLRQSHATLNHYLDHNLQMENMLGASHLPLTVLVDAQGRVVDKVYGAQSWDSAGAARLLRQRFHLSVPATGTRRTAWRTAIHGHDLDQGPRRRPPV